MAKPELGENNANDILRLNVGGRTGIAVSRRTLTVFRKSMLAEQFSGRCDAMLDRDSDGNIFIDQDPDLFQTLLNFLRDKNNEGNNDRIKAIAPPCSHRFDLLLSYYGLLHEVYGFGWTFDPKQSMAYRDVLIEDNCVTSPNTTRTFVFAPEGHSRSIKAFTLKILSDDIKLEAGFWVNQPDGDYWKAESYGYTMEADFQNGVLMCHGNHCRRNIQPSIPKGSKIRFTATWDKGAVFSCQVLGSKGLKFDCQAQEGPGLESYAKAAMDYKIPYILLRGKVEISEVELEG